MNRRVALFDNIKFILIFLMVFGHLIESFADDINLYKGLFVFIYAFHMPLFIFLSGLFYKKSSVKKNMILYLILWFLVYCLNHLVYRYLRPSPPAFSPLLKLDGLPWFMFATAAFYGLTGLLDQFDRKKVLLISLIPPLISGFFPVIRDAFALSRIIVYYPFFLAGSLIRANGVLKLKQNKTFRIIGITALAVWFICCMIKPEYAAQLRHLFTGRNPFNPKYFPFGPVLRIACYGLTCALSAGIISLTPEKDIPYITVFGQRTVQVYFWSTAFHAILILPRSIYTSLAHSVFGVPGILIIALIEVCILSTKAASFPTSLIMKTVSEKVS